MSVPTPKDTATAVPADLPQWPDRSHRTVAEVWMLTPEQVAVEQKQHEEPQQRDWRRDECL